jgi:hypothetical protein
VAKAAAAIAIILFMAVSPFGVWEAASFALRRLTRCS